MKSGVLEQSLNYLDWVFFAHAVLLVFEENLRADEKAQGYTKANSDVWAWHSLKRQEIFRRTLAHWCHVSGEDESCFPYSEDAIAKFYLRIRKRSAEEAQSFREEINRSIRDVSSFRQTRLGIS